MLPRTRIAGASIEDVRARSGASVGSVYHHFGGKEALAGAVFVAASASHRASFLAALGPHPEDAEAGIGAVVHAHLRWCLYEQPAYGRFPLVHGDAAPSAASDELAAQNREFYAATRRSWPRSTARPLGSGWRSR